MPKYLYKISDDQLFSTFSQYNLQIDQVFDKQLIKYNSTKMVECLLCAQQCEFLGISECNHQPMCFRCIYKMRVISKNNFCPICKFESKHIIVAKQFQPFQTFKNDLIPDKTYSDILYADASAKDSFQKLTQFKCFFKTGAKLCKNQKKFPSVAFLKKHLKEDHNRYMCQICLERKTCVLEQQKLYSYQALNKHLQRGDLDQCGNVTFMHPICKFCTKQFFDQDIFKLHMNIEHMICNVCGPNYKYFYYKNYQSLETHYKISHYVCSENSCLNKKFIAFSSAEELRIHRAQAHDKLNGKRVDLREMCGFQSQGHNSLVQEIQIKDNEGINMENQYLSLKKTKNRALAQADQQNDLPLDIRDFYQCDLDDDEHLQKAFILKYHRKQNQQKITNANNKKKKYIQKSQVQKEKPLIAKENQNFNVEDLLLIKTINSPRLSYEIFQQHLQRVLRQDQINSFNEWRFKLSKNKMKTQQFVTNFFDMMKNLSLKSAYNIFPQYIRTIVNQQLKYQLDKQFLKKLRQLPSQSHSLLMASSHYSDFFGTLFKQIQLNIESRIVDGSLSIKKPIKRLKQRLYQLIGVVRRLKIQQMAKLKFISNFGVQKDTIEYLVEKIFKCPKQNIQKKLSKIQNEQILDLYIFVKYCFNAIKHSKGMILEKNKIHDEILQDFLFQRPYLQKQYGKKKTDLNLQEQVQFEKELQQKKFKKHLKQIQMQNKKRGITHHTDFNLVDKGDFPQLVTENATPKKLKTQQPFKQVIKQRNQKPATYQKKMNEMFPALGEQLEQKKQKEIQKGSKKQKAWWQKLNNDRPLQEDIQVVKVTKKGKKKKVQWVQVTGLFN